MPDLRRVVRKVSNGSIQDPSPIALNVRYSRRGRQKPPDLFRPKAARIVVVNYVRVATNMKRFVA